MNYNNIETLQQFIAHGTDELLVRHLVNGVLTDIDRIYSYLVCAKYKNGEKVGLVINYNFSQTDSYNTIHCDEQLIDTIVRTVIDNLDNNKYVVGYKQPSAEIMILAYEPLMCKLAKQQSERWNVLEYDDALSIAKIVMYKLYRKGYYIHKQVFIRAFYNEVLLELRQYKNEPDIISIDNIIFEDSEDKTITYLETLYDKTLELEQEEKEHHEIVMAMFGRVKELIISFSSERQFEQLLREYGSKTTTQWSRKKMQTIKNKFKKLGITLQSIEKDLY